MRAPPRPRLLLLGLVGLVPFLVVCAGGAPPKGDRPPPPRPAPDAQKPRLPEVDKLIEAQKLDEATRLLDKAIADARQQKDDALLAYALVRRSQLRIALGGHETAVRELKAEAWPKAPVPAIATQLYYANTLASYLRHYGWEIGQREKIETKARPDAAVDLKSFSKEQIVAEATRAYAAIWQRRAELDGWPVGLLSPYLEPNSYPDNVRGTLRDAVSYLFVEHLVDSSLWRADESNELFRLDVERLLQGGARAVELDGGAHPVEKVATVLEDLERFHVRDGRAEAALEARLELMRRLRAAFSDARERRRITAAVERRLTNERQRPWWAMGQALLAEWANEDGDRVRAHRLAKECAAAYPTSMGGLVCQELVATLEAPDYALQAMAVDALGKPSVTITARNLPRLYLRAYPIDLRARLASARDYNVLYNGEELRRLLAGKPTASWSVELPASPDFRSHRTHAKVPIAKKGFYAIVGSARADFGEQNNRLIAAQMAISDLVLNVRVDQGRGVDVSVFDGPSGQLVDGASVELWAMDWQRGHHRVAERRTDARGHAFLDSKGGNSVFVLASRGEDLTVDPHGTYVGGRSEPSVRTASLVYTDRSVYRPGQRVLWKAVVYSGRGKDGRFQVLPNHAFTVRLRDANHQEVQRLDVKSNTYGSAAGELTIPAAGRLLGSWQVETSVGGAQSIRVEEYKRPTFEVTLKEPPAPLRLNQDARVMGEARYYFGLPLTSGKARYVVTREPVYPYWWYWYWPQARGGVQTIARGDATIAADGGFSVQWRPEAKADLDARVSYRYQVSVDVTDEGGETRSASRAYRVGRATVEAYVTSERGFFDAGQPVTIALRRSDLDGNPRAGKGTWRLVTLDAPRQAPLPAQLPPVVGAQGEGEEGEAATQLGKVLTAGDRQRARFETRYDPVQLLASFKDQRVVSRSDVTTDDKGQAALALGALGPGAYRLRYETRDEHGGVAEAFCDFVVAGGAPLPLPALLRAEQTLVRVGEPVRLLVSSGLADQPLLLETFRAGEAIDRRVVSSGVIELPMKEADRGGLAFVLTAVRDHQAMTLTQSVSVPWDNQALKLSFATFRDKVRPGAKETFRVTVESDGKKPARLPAGAAELLAYMYDRSLDLFAPHHPPSPLSLFPGRAYATSARTTLGVGPTSWLSSDQLRQVAGAPRPRPDRFVFEDAYGIGGLGLRGTGMGGGGFGHGRMPVARMAAQGAPPPPPQAPAPEATTVEAKKDRAAKQEAVEAPDADRRHRGDEGVLGKKASAEAEPVRSNFAETAFFQPSLITDGKGEASFEFTVPDSVTSWSVWVHAITRDLRSGSVQKETRSVKELMVRPYLPRFFREGDEAELKVVVNNAGGARLEGTLSFDIVDPESKQSRAGLFNAAEATRPFVVEAGKSASFTFPVRAPRQLGQFAVLARATAKVGKEAFSDGELRPIPVLPSRLHLTQSRFVTLRDADRRTMSFPDLDKQDDPSRVNEQMVVTLDAQLFYTVLRALPYLIEYPYECAEQTLNRFVSTGIVTSLFAQYPSVQKMAEQMSRRTTQLQAWDGGDANRKMALEEAPFVWQARGGARADEDAPLVNVLDQRIARMHRDAALEKLRKTQTSIGAWSWFPGGPPSPYMTLYVLYGFAKAAEFKVEVPKDLVQRGWRYLALHYRGEYAHRMLKEDCCWEFLALLNYVASSYPDASWTGEALTLDERKQILEHTFRHWKQHAPYVKGLLALTLKRMGRAADGKKVFDSVMDSAKTTRDQGTFWAPEDRSWLWYRDTIESHAFALRVLMELDPKNEKKDGLVLWLLLNKKLNQWKSTRATAEVIYSLAQYMKADQSLGVREAATVSIGARQQTFTFEPDRYVGKVQMILKGEEIDPRAAVTVEKTTKGVMFASATWSFATDRLPSEARGDFFSVGRRYFLRENDGKKFVLRPLAEGQVVRPGDEVEVELQISAKHEAEYVHLRDPRGAGFEPGSVRSQWKWDLGIGWYEEIRDSGTNFFFERLPAGQYSFRYRLRATTAGKFRVGPATLQSMYAPEFSAYSAGHLLQIAAQ